MALFGIVPLLGVLLLFSWFYRLASRQILRYSVAWKLVFLFFGVFIPLGVVVGQVVPGENQAVRLVFGALYQLAAGTLFIGNFAVNTEGVRPGMALGLKVTALSMAYQLAVLGALFVLLAAIRSTVGTS